MEREHRVTIVDIVISLVLGLIAVVLIGLSIFIFTDTNKRFENYKEVVAVVSDVRYRRSGRGTHYYLANYKYVVDGKSYTYKDGKRHSYKPTVGSKIVGYYDPNNHKKFYPGKRYYGLSVTGILGSIMIFCTIGSIIEMRTKNDREKAKALHGIIRSINIALFSALIAIWCSVIILIVGIVLSALMMFDSIQKLRKLKEQYGY